MRQTVQDPQRRAERGSGTVIASVPGETLILTAVARRDGGVRTSRSSSTGATSAAAGSRGLTEAGPRPPGQRDARGERAPTSDVALLRIKGMRRPAVHRAVEAGGRARQGRGVDLRRDRPTLHLTQWKATVKGAAVIDIAPGREAQAVPGDDPLARPRPVRRRPLPRRRHGGRRLHRTASYRGRRDDQASSPRSRACRRLIREQGRSKRACEPAGAAGALISV